MSPRRNHSSSTMIERKCSFLVVSSGKPSARSKRICAPNQDSVPVPVRSCCSTPAVEDQLHEVEILAHEPTLDARSTGVQERVDCSNSDDPFRTLLEWAAAPRPIGRRMRYQRAELPLKLDGLAAAAISSPVAWRTSTRRAKACGSPMSTTEARCLHLSRHDGDETGAEFPAARRSSPTPPTHGSAGLVLAHNHPSGDRPAERQRLPCDPPSRDRRRSARLHGARSSGVRRSDSAPASRQLGYL